MPLSAQQLAAQKNLSYVLAEKLAQRILKGEYEPGTILPGEIELGEQFGVSRTAVREAVKNVNGKRDGFTATANWYPSHATIELEFS
ncbi:GntR family transcriptional regulator [Escherichia coli]|nr:GntR family transcriptional regulator [Escherichia coli]